MLIYLFATKLLITNNNIIFVLRPAGRLRAAAQQLLRSRSRHPAAAAVTALRFAAQAAAPPAGFGPQGLNGLTQV